MLQIVTNLHPASRFHVSLIPAALPSKCIVCGSPGGDGRKFIDFGFDIDGYGTVYWCSVCLIEPINHLGWISQDQWTLLNETNEKLIERIQSLETINAHLRDGYSSLSHLNDYLSVLGSNLQPSKEDAGILSESNVSERQTDLSEGQNNSGSDESIDESRSEDISDTNEFIESNDGSDFDFGL